MKKNKRKKKKVNVDQLKQAGKPYCLWPRFQGRKGLAPDDMLMLICEHAWWPNFSKVTDDFRCFSSQQLKRVRLANTCVPRVPWRAAGAPGGAILLWTASVHRQAGLMGLCSSCRVAVSLLPLCSPSWPWSGPLSLWNSSALGVEGEQVWLTPTQQGGSHPQQEPWQTPGLPLQHWQPSEIRGCLFVLKESQQQVPMAAPAPCLASCHARGPAGLASPYPPATAVKFPHTLLMAAPPPDYRGPHEIVINNDRSHSTASIPCPTHAGLAPVLACGPRCSGLVSQHPYIDMVPPHTEI